MNKMIDNSRLNNNASFHVQTTQKQGYRLITITGKMVYENTELTRKYLLDSIADNTKHIIDGTGLTQIDSTGFGALITFSREVASHKSKMAFFLKENFIKELFLIAKFDQVFPIGNNEQEAIKLLDELVDPSIKLKNY